MSLSNNNSSSMDILQAYFDDLLSENSDNNEQEIAPGPLHEETYTSPHRQYHAFELSNLRLLIPKETVARIETTPPALNRLHACNWLAGHCIIQERRIAVIDPQLLLGMQKAAITSERPGVIICLEGRDYGIGVPLEGSLVDINPDVVTWRGQDGSRPWLAGTIASSHSVLLDLDGLDSMIDSGSYSNDE